MSVTISLTFEDEWAQRLAPMIRDRVDDRRGHPLTVQILDHYGIASVDDLTVKQAARFELLFYLLTCLAQYEQRLARIEAEANVWTDLQETFPLDIPDATIPLAGSVTASGITMGDVTT